MPDTPPFFSVIIPTRDRTSLFKDALDSVLRQKFSSLEVIVVSDGSTGDELEIYKSIERNHSSVNFHYLEFRPNGHGPNYSRNYGAYNARGRYLCFLDDDDYWTDDYHLENAYKSITASQEEVDLYYTNQDAYLPSGERVVPGLWISALANKLADYPKDEFGAHRVSAEFLMQSKGFAHMNCSIIRRAFYFSIGEMDETLRYEGDRDLYLRSMDSADCILHNPAVVAYHRVPEAKKANNVSTVLSSYRKHLSQLTIFNKGCVFSKRRCVYKHCLDGKGYQLKHLSEALYRDGHYKYAMRYASQALVVQPSVKWLIRLLQISSKALFERKDTDVSAC